jgi:hypothetical protein
MRLYEILVWNWGYTIFNTNVAVTKKVDIDLEGGELDSQAINYIDFDYERLPHIECKEGMCHLIGIAFFIDVDLIDYYADMLVKTAIISMNFKNYKINNDMEIYSGIMIPQDMHRTRNAFDRNGKDAIFDFLEKKFGGDPNSSFNRLFNPEKEYQFKNMLIRLEDDCTGFVIAIMEILPE